MNQVPGAALRSDRIEAEDAADDDAVFEHVVVVVAPFAGRSASEVGGVEAQLGRGGGGRRERVREPVPLNPTYTNTGRAPGHPAGKPSCLIS
jgi:hypothetical protein